MPRIARALVDGFIYHIINRSNGRQTIFHQDEDYKAFVNLIKEARNRYSVKILAYCLMPNHFHIVMIPVKAEELSKCIQWLMTSHVRRHHKKYETTGHIWQGRFKSFIIQKDDHLLTVLRYVEGNPIRAALVTSAKEWLWSSHKERIGMESTQILSEIPLKLPLNWSKYVNQPLTNRDLERLHLSVRRQSPFGDSEWQKKICRNFGLGHTLRPRGRPRKRIKK